MLVSYIPLANLHSAQVASSQFTPRHPYTFRVSNRCEKRCDDCRAAGETAADGLKSLSKKKRNTAPGGTRCQSTPPLRPKKHAALRLTGNPRKTLKPRRLYRDGLLGPEHGLEQGLPLGGRQYIDAQVGGPQWHRHRREQYQFITKKRRAGPDAAKGALFEIHGDQETFNLHQMLYEKTFESEYFKALFIFKTFDKVVDVIYEKVTYVEPWAATEVRSPSSAYCLLLKLFHLRLTEPQVRALLDHGDSTYIRALGALYVRYACPPEDLWRWLAIMRMISRSSRLV